LCKLAPIVDALARHGAVSHTVELWPDESNPPTKVNFAITAVYGFDGVRLEAEWVFLAEQLAASNFNVQRPIPDPSNNSVHIVASMNVGDPRSGKSSRKGGKKRNATS
jgi:hypothetical protein